MTAPPALVEQLVDDCIERENFKPFMYRDNSANGWVTVGIGHKLNSAYEAARMPFMVGSRAATAAEISSDFVRVLSMPIGYVADHYQVPSSPLISRDYAVQDCRDMLAHTFLPGILSLVPDIYSRPPEVARALVTIEYTSGLGGLKGFTHMLASLRAGDYQGIVDRREYHMKASEATNDRLRAWFQAAAHQSSS